jgi:transcriptional regulator with XRE-family HTH domain
VKEEIFNLKEELKSIGMTQKDFAKYIEFHTNTVSRWVRGEDEIPKWVKLLIEHYKKSKLFDELSVKINNY